MRCLLLTSVVMLAGLPATAGAQAPFDIPGAVVGVTHTPGQAPAKRTVYLNHVMLEELKKTNPEHYSQARKIMAAATKLCAPGAPQVWKTLNLPPVSCTGMALKTSFPPKRDISFQLGDTRYIALVTVRDAPAIPSPAGQYGSPQFYPLK
jgi:hypothetical protein